MSFKSNVGKPVVDVALDQCEMRDVHRSDCACASCEMRVDPQCLEQVVGVVSDNCDVRVCASCAVQAEREHFVVSYRDEVRFVAVHPEMGIYLGSGFGLGFWSKLDPVGQDSAIAFVNRSMADQVMDRWSSGRPSKVTLWPVIPDTVLTLSPTLIKGARRSVFACASIAACVSAGLEAWDPDAKSAT